MLRRSDIKLSVSDDDYEESLLIGNYMHLVETGQARLNAPKVSQKRETYSSTTGLYAGEADQLKKIVATLGYDPVAGRAQRHKGRTRQAAIPNPLPPVGTELQSCLGDTYTVLGYVKKPRGGNQPSQILYSVKTEPHGWPIVRGINNLLVGALASGIPIVTWDNDPRGLKPMQPVPLNKRRTLTKRELMDDDHADPDKKPLTQAEMRRRFGFGNHREPKPRKD